MLCDWIQQLPLHMFWLYHMNTTAFLLNVVDAALSGRPHNPAEEERAERVDTAMIHWKFHSMLLKKARAYKNSEHIS